ncbi:MAG: thiamine-phosphate kinase [Parvibaculum sp.]|uniref:thiamine-phosphate kinase n=1 Tax=Parvibaculum sp. TaxID=2024848 RepID=UPI0025CFD3C0|nr:thiamine-phosphate kinase [Parvibaculum sp.]MCE9650226.1 thiamine-phosphate kinase [Parvibaculum sp.]
MASRPDEFTLIADIFAPLSAKAPGAYGLRDDAASFTPRPGFDLVLTVDALVEGVHFFSSDPADMVARKLLRVSLSDLAAKGAVPRGYLLTAAWTSQTPLEWMHRFALGLSQDQLIFDMDLWGGDTVSTSGPLTFSLTAIGEIPAGQILRRGGAKAGDALFITGTVGDAALGLAVAQGRLAEDPHLLTRYRLPEPRVSVGAGLRGIAHAALDVSDGLMADLKHLCEVSGVGARVDVASVPLSPAAKRCLASDSTLIETVLTGGDDYEILFAAPIAKSAEIDSLAAATGVPITRIGAVLDPTEGLSAIAPSGEPMALKRLGFRHF